MRTLLGIASIAILASTPALAQSHHVSLAAKSVANGGGSKQDNSQSSSGRTDSFGRGYTQTQSTRVHEQTHQTSVEITVRNFGKEPENIEVQWFFIGASVEQSSRQEIIDSGKKDLQILGSKTTVFVATSTPVKSSIISATTTGQSNGVGSNRSYLPTSSTERVGTKMKGWIVRLVADGTVIQSVGSTSYFKELGADSKKLDNMERRPTSAF